MNTDLQMSLTAPIEEYLIRFKEVYRESLKSDIKLINTVIRYISRKKGKQLRPYLCLLSARLCGEPTENTFRAAALIEMIHVATLIHDDVVDEADIRRGWPSVGRIWKNKVAILVGDYLFSNALSKMCDIDDWDALSVLSKTAKRLSRGEIMQIESALSKDLDEDGYLKMVKDKTSSLLLSINFDKNEINIYFNEINKFIVFFQNKERGQECFSCISDNHHRCPICYQPFLEDI